MQNDDEIQDAVKAIVKVKKWLLETGELIPSSGVEFQEDLTQSLVTPRILVVGHFRQCRRP